MSSIDSRKPLFGSGACVVGFWTTPRRSMPDHFVIASVSASNCRGMELAMMTELRAPASDSWRMSSNPSIAGMSMS
jgi:hypothetical protein